MRTNWKQSFYLSNTKGRDLKKDDGTYPIKLRVWAGHLGKTGMYNTGFYANSKDFESSMSINPRGKNLELKEKLMTYYSKTDKIFEDTSVFTLAQFSASLRPKPKKEASLIVWDFMENQMLPGYSKISTRTSVNEGLKWVKSFKKNLTFLDFDVKTLKKFRVYMIDKGLSHQQQIFI